MEQGKSTMTVAGVDIGKRWLDAAVHGRGGHGVEPLTRVANTAEGFDELIGWLRTQGVGRVGMEATGGYERGVRAALDQAGFEVVLHQPIEVRLFAKLKRKRAKNDQLDARLIAAATVGVEAVKAAQDPRLVELAERLTVYEQITDQAAELKAFLEQVTLPDLIDAIESQIEALTHLKTELVAQILARIKAEPDLKARFALLTSLPGIGPIVAATLVVRMPELGAMQRGQASSLLGVAPFDRDSGQWRGKRYIGGGRSRPRRMLYLAALSAKRCDPGLKAFALRLIEHGKPAKLVTVAVMRKLIEAANLVLQRGTPWVKQPSST
jgi:transposase